MPFTSAFNSTQLNLLKLSSGDKAIEADFGFRGSTPRSVTLPSSAPTVTVPSQPPGTEPALPTEPPITEPPAGRRKRQVVSLATATNLTVCV